MRKALIAVSTVAFALSAIAAIETASAADKLTKMGCMVGKQKWDATAGKCMDAPATVKKAKKSAKASKAAVAKKAA